MGANYSLLLAKINEFTRKFYINQLLRGLMLSAAFILAVYLCLFVWVYYAFPSVGAKTSVFFIFVLLSLVALAYWVLKPLTTIIHLKKGLNHEQAAVLIGKHFTEIKDRLLNTLQLQEQAQHQIENSALLLASIDQKINELKPIPFSNAIQLGENKKNLKYLAPPLAIILLIAIIAPAILREGTYSFIRYNQEILPKAPFQFVLQNTKLKVVQGDDFNLELKLTGDQFPQDIYVEDGTNNYKLERKDLSHFNYTFQNLQETKTIRLKGGGFYSSSYEIVVVPRPNLLGINAKLIYPAYLAKKDEEINNVGDLILPEGTKINWQIRAENTNNILFKWNGKVNNLFVKNNETAFSANIRQNGQYQVLPQNALTTTKDTVNHLITIIKDEFPSIDIEEVPDSLSSKVLYFNGRIRDDYGFSSLKMKYQLKEGNKIIKEFAMPISIHLKQLENTFFYAWNLNNIATKPGQEIVYFFEVADNDGVNGSKITRSEIKIYQVPSQQQMAEQLAEGSQSLKQKMEQSIKLANQIEKESKKIAESLLDKKQLDFEDKKQIEQLLNKQKQLEDAVKDIKALNEKNNLKKDENNVLNDELKEKQKQIDNLFNNILDEKTKELLNKLQQMMEQNNKDNTRDELSKMQMDNKSLKNELDRILELYKQLEFEQNLQNKIDRLNDLAKKQQELSKETADKNKNAHDLKEKQEQLNKDFKDLEKEIQDLEKKNQQLERPNPFENPKEESKQIEQKQQESTKNLEQNNRQKAAETQKQAAEQMQKMADKMQEQQQSGAEMENNINAQELRKLLESLLKASFEQEKVMLNLQKLSSNDPSYTLQAQQQSNIRDNMKIIADSLYSLSKKVPQIESTVNAELDKINFNIGKSIELLEDRRTAEANRNQQFTMTSMNNLALMMNDALDQLQNAMKNAKSGKGKAKKQGMKQLQQMQEQLNKNMQQAKQKMEQQGNQGKVPKGQMSEEFAKMAQQQQMIREALQKINREDNKDGKGGLGNLNQMSQEMKQTELDLVNKRITEETIKRQNKLMVKLLEAEKAQKEQQEDEKRESQSAKQFPPNYQKMLEQYQRKLQSESELIQKLPPNLNHYYRNKVTEYFKLLNSEK